MSRATTQLRVSEVSLKQQASPAENDNSDYCQTPAELAVIEEEGGSPSGPLLRAVNSIAAHVGAKFPRVLIETLAYDYSIQPPKLTRPLENVLITFCTSGTSMGTKLTDAHALPLTDPLNAPMREALEAWSTAMGGQGQLRVWDYVENL